MFIAAIALAAVLGAGAIQPAQAQTFTVVANIGPLNPSVGFVPGVVRDAAGNLYGAAPAGGNTTGACAIGCGTLFKVDTTGTVSVLYKFTGGTDGYSAFGGLIVDTAGNLYGASGTALFKLDTSGTFTVLHTGDGSLAGLVRDAAGNLYGVNKLGGFTGGICGANGCGIVFKLDTLGNYTVLYSFTGSPDGAYPAAGLVLDSAGNLYGTTQGGGIIGGVCNTGLGCGTVFKLDASNSFAETVLYSFTGAPDGAAPEAGLTLDAAGNLYGTTYSGGLLDCFEPAGTIPPTNKKIYCGVVFKVDTTGTETVLHSFTGIPDGALPKANLVMDAAGELYGTTVEGGSSGFFGCEILSQPIGCGSIFKVDPATGTLSVLYSFTGGVDFGYPVSALTLDPSGNLYGTALDAVFKLDPLGTPNYVLSVWNGTAAHFAGTFTVNGVACGSICSEFFPKGTAVTLTAVPAAGNTFTGWIGPCSGTGACSLTMNSAQLVFGNFAALPLDFSLSASALTPATVSAGGSSTSTLTVAAIGGFNNSVAFTCAVTPTPALAPTCAVSPSSVMPGTPATLTVKTTAPTAAAMSSRAASRMFYALFLPLIGLVGIGLGSDRKLRKELVAAALVILLFAGLVLQVACGGSSNSSGGGGSKGTPSGQYMITVTGTYSTGSLTHTTPTIMLTVQ